MAINSVPSQTLTVRPLVDYEPPVRPVAQHRPPLPPLPRCRHVPQSVCDRPPTVPLSPTLRTVTAFADAALRRVLEVVDQRRPVAHLHRLLVPGLVDSVLPARSATVERGGAATLQRVRAQLVGSAEPAVAAEVFASYRRDGRIHALACRVERVRAGTAPGWQVVALHIG